MLIKLNDSVRVSNELGAGHPKSAAFSVLVVTFTSFIIALILAIIVLLLRHVISYVFTSGTTVSDAVAELTPFLAVAIILNGIQPVLSGMFPAWPSLPTQFRHSRYLIISLLKTY